MEHSTEQHSSNKDDSSLAQTILKKLDALLTQADDFNKFLHNKKKKNEKRVKDAEEDDEGEEIPNQASYLVRQPTLLKKVGGNLKNYQLQALNWMISLRQADLNGILADDMGLGKTIQTISFLAYLSEFKSINGPHLIVAPLTTLKNWMNELSQWFPSCNAIMLLATQKQRNLTYESHIKHRNFDVVVTSYQGIVSCFEWLTKIKWNVLVVDEAHKIKNDEAMVSQSMRWYQTEFKLLLTGTPLSNDLHELWSLLNFILPQIFDDQSIFDDIFQYIESLTGDQKHTQQLMIAEKVHLILSPYMKRRTKKEVETTLPPKFEKTLYITLTPLQITMYRNYIKYRNPSGKSISVYNNRSMQMRKICCHPYLFPDIEPKGAALLGTHLITTSGKMIVLDKLLEKLLPQGHKVLIFSQFTSMLDILQDYCAFRDYNFCRIDGSTSLSSRQSQITTFRSSPTSQLFLLSTKSGGLGINLVTADVVILYDMDWNPQNDNQAMDRAYRIGQTKPVHVYKFICEHTIEERMSEVQKTKLIWDDLVIQKGAVFMRSQPTVKASDIDRMAKMGVGEIFRFDGGVTGEDIDQIIRLGEEKDMRKVEEIRRQLEERIKQQMGNIEALNPYAALTEGKQDDHVPDKNYDQQIQNYLNNRKPKQNNKKTVEKLPEFQLYHQKLELEEYISRLDESTEQYRTELEEKIKKLKARGFPDWTEKEFDKFVEANMTHQSNDYRAISDEIKTKTTSDVQTYSKEFFKMASKFPQLKKHLKKISTAQQNIQKYIMHTKALAWKRKHNDKDKYILPKLQRHRRKYIDSAIANYVLDVGASDIEGLHKHLQKDPILALNVQPVWEKKNLQKKVQRVIEFMDKERNDEGEKKNTKSDSKLNAAIKFFMKQDKMEEDNITVTTEAKTDDNDNILVDKVVPKDKKTTKPKPASKAKPKSKSKKSLDKQSKIDEVVSQQNE